MFPECFLTGYCVSSREDAGAIALEPSWEGFDHIQSLCQELDVLVVVGYAGWTPDRKIANFAALFEKGQVRRDYQKTHLPELGLDKFVEPGNQLPVFQTRFGTIGMLICFDLRFPESVRTLSLQSADLVVLPTNWPEGAEMSADVICRVRAAENKVFLATCNRVGTENGFTFIGKSKILNPMGAVLAEAEASSARIVAELDFAEARNKRIVTKRGEYEITVFQARRPELYQPLIASNEGRVD